jgi:hypothetical protein
MTLTPQHEQFIVDAGLHDHLADNSEILTEILSAIGEQTAIAALSSLLSGTACCAQCHARDVRTVVECLCGAYDVPCATRPDFDAAVRWQGARLSDLHLFRG